MPHWNINLVSNQQQLRSLDKLEPPFGFNLQTTSPHVEAPKKKQLIENKLFELATSSKGQILMTFLALFFFIGNQLHIYSIFMIVQTLWSSVGGIIKVNKVFEPYEELTKSLTKYKLIYVAINFVSLGAVLFKLSKIGLLSFSPAAYIDLIQNYEGPKVIAGF